PLLRPGAARPAWLRAEPDELPTRCRYLPRGRWDPARDRAGGGPAPPYERRRARGPPRRSARASRGDTPRRRPAAPRPTRGARLEPRPARSAGTGRLPAARG